MPESWSVNTNRWIAFALNVLAVSGIVGGTMFAAMTWALDGRYVPAETQAQIDANTKAVRALQNNLTTLSDVLVGEAVFSKRMAYCETTNAAHRQEIDRQLSILIARYVELTGKQPYLPSCR
jgi:hypothetical protein